jgi:hypothetical protein
VTSGAQTVGTTQATGTPSDSPTSAPSIEAASLAKDRGISIVEAERRLAWQSVAPDLQDSLTADLGDNFGGVWVDTQDGDRVKVGVVGSVDASTAIVRRDATALGLNEAYDLVAVRRSFTALTQDMDALGPQIARMNAGAAATLSAGIRTDLNAIELDVPATGLTAAQQNQIDNLRARLGDELVTAPANTYVPRACVGTFCDPPLRGGIAINTPVPLPNGKTGLSGCTGGFIARSRVDDQLFQFTAGHCGQLNSSPWATTLSDGANQVIGPVWHWNWNYNGDVAILHILDPIAWMPQGIVQVLAGPQTTANPTYTITADKFNVIGQRICFTGAGTGGSRCGSVTGHGIVATYGGVTVSQLGRADICNMPGDSGAPMYSFHVAYGILVAGPKDVKICDTLYQGIKLSQQLMNVQVLHS